MLNKKVLKSLALVTIGSAIFAFAINWLLIPNEMGEGGVTGTSLLLLYTLGFEPAYSSLVINICLLIIGWRFLERSTLYYTIVAVILLSFFQKVFQPVGFVPESPIVVSLLCGVLMGIGIGLVILGGGTTAGGDIIVMMVNKYLGISMSAAFLIVDAIVILSTTVVIGIEKAVLTLAMIFIFTKVLNFILEGFNPRKSVMIISEQPDAIAELIKQRIQRGITVFKGQGFYTKQDRDILYIVVSRNQILPLQRAVQEVDSNAFMTISDVQQVHGEGFSFYRDETTGEKISPR